MIDLVEAKKPVLLRRSGGSHPEIVRVYAYDPNNGTAAVRLKFDDDTFQLDLLSFEECEATDAESRYVDVNQVLANRASDKIPKL